MAVFEELRISLSRPDLPPVLGEIDHQESVGTRREFFDEAFSRRLDFLYQGRKFSYLPAGVHDGTTCGFFGREINEQRHAGPDDNFRLVNYHAWDLAFFAIDLGETSQIAFMQRNEKVGSPRPVLESFFDGLAQSRGLRDWEAHIRYISSPVGYWDAVRRYEGRITKLSFVFIPPNALRAEERVMDFIRDASKNARASIVRHEYENRQGHINPRGDLVEGSVKVATQGGGDASIQVGRKTVYSSKTQKMTTDVPESEIPELEDRPGIRNLIRRLFEQKNSA